jgi:hypothetical protein
MVKRVERERESMCVCERGEATITTTTTVLSNLTNLEILTKPAFCYQNALTQSGGRNLERVKLLTTTMFLYSPFAFIPTVN